jgi:hypothetical protein
MALSQKWLYKMPTIGLKLKSQKWLYFKSPQIGLTNSLKVASSKSLQSGFDPHSPI